MTEYERTRRGRRRVALFVVLGILGGAGVWLTVPYGLVLLTTGILWGLLLVACGVLLLGGCVTCLVVAVRVHVAPQSLPGRENPAFDEPVPSSDPRPGVSWSGSQLGSR